MENTTPTPVSTPAPVTPAPTPAPNQSATLITSTQSTILVRYPNLLILILALRVLSVVFLILGLVIGLAQFFHDTTFLVKVGYFFLYVMLGCFQGVMCWTMSEAIQVWMDTEAQTRPADTDARLRALFNSSK